MLAEHQEKSPRLSEKNPKLSKTKGEKLRISQI